MAKGIGLIINTIITEHSHSCILGISLCKDVTSLGYNSTSNYNTNWPPAESGKFDTTWTVAGVADFQGSGFASILWVNSSTGEVGLSNFTQPYPLKIWGTVFAKLPTGMQVQAVGDLNGDSSADLILTNPSTGASSIWFMGFFGGDYYQAGPSILNSLGAAWQIQGDL